MYNEDKEFRSVDTRPVRVVTKYYPLTQSSSSGIITMYSSSKMAAVSAKQCIGSLCDGSID